MSDDLMLVGSMPYDTAEEAFRAIGPKLGQWLPFIPDGEIGDRLYWVNHVAYRVFHGHPDIETVQRPLTEDGVELWHTMGENNRWLFKVRDGVEQVRFGDPGWRLGYARDAINSYFVFKTLRAEGTIPVGVKFQVCVPMVASATRRWFSAEDYPRVRDGFTEAMRLELETMCARIPHEDLSIQWDCAIEDTIIEEALDNSGDDAEAAAADLFEPAKVLGPAVPEAVAFGYHACYGTAGGWPRRSPQDLTGAVLLLNAAVAASGRKVDFLHLPTVVSTDGNHKDYVAPLASLEHGGARVYIGLIHALHDGAKDGMRGQMEAALEHLGDMGVAAPCGFGRGPGKMSAASKGGAAMDIADANAYMDGLIADHVKAVELLQEVRGN